MDSKPGTKLRLEPCGLRRHDSSAVRNCNKLLHRHRIKGERHFHLSAVNSVGQFGKSADAADKINPLVCAQVFYVQYLVQHQIGKNGHVKHFHRIIITIPSCLSGKRIPIAAKLKRKIVQPRRMIYFFPLLLHDEILFKGL